MEMNRASARRRLSPVANDRPITRKAVEAISSALHATFQKLGTDIVNQARPRLPSMSAAADDRKRRYFYFEDADEVMREISFDRLDTVVPSTAAHLIIVASDSADTALARTGVTVKI